MRGKCERGRGNINADGAGAEVFAGDGCSQGASFVPMALISRRWRGGRNIIIRVRASCCGESALNPPTSPPIPRRRPAPAPAQRRALPEHFRPPPQPRRTPADLTTHSPPKTFARPRTLPLPHAVPTHPRRLRDAFLADLTTHFPSKICSRPPHSDTPYPSTFSLTPRPDAPHAAPTHTRRLRDAFPADLTTHSPPKAFVPPRTATHPPPQRLAASPSVPLWAQKNGTAQWMCDAECLGRPSLRSVIGVGEPRAVRRRCGALAWRVGLRPQPWALRSRRCGRVLRA